VAHTWDGEPVGPDEQVTVVWGLEGDELVVHVDAPHHGDPLPDAPRGTAVDGLWNHEVVELFLLGEAERYLELELGPGGHHLALALDGVRRPVASGLPVGFTATREGGRWRGTARLTRAHVPQPVRAFNAYAIHGVGEARRYLCHAPSGGAAPDFHRLDAFVSLTG